VLPGAAPNPAADEVAVLVSFPLEDFFLERVPYQAIDLGRYLSPIFHFEAGAMYGATAHILLELLQLYGSVCELELPRPELTTILPWA
jgi:hypothetical protein